MVENTTAKVYGVVGKRLRSAGPIIYTVRLFDSLFRQQKQH